MIRKRKTPQKSGVFNWRRWRDSKLSSK